jgi:hypothetical protein
VANAAGWQQRAQRGNGEQVAPRADRCAGDLPAWVEVRGGLPGWRSSAQAVRRHDGEARAIRLKRDGEARAERRGPALHGFSLSWLDRYAGSGHDSVRANTRREYRRLLVNFALTYFDREIRVRDLDRAAAQHFVDWLTTAAAAPGGCATARSPTR